jgi:MYXO-CTERM domain-containing protein
MSRVRLLMGLVGVLALAPRSVALAQTRVQGRCANTLPADARYVRHMSVFMGNRLWPFVIVLPAGYDANADIRYPVIYQFHGRTDDECIGPERGMIDRVKAAAVTAGVGKFLYVFLSGGEQCNYMDNNAACPNQMAESYIIQELIPYVDANYKTIPDRSGRALDGFSMGADGVARFGYKYSDRFCSFVSYSGNGVPPDLQANRAKILADRLKTRFVVGSTESNIMGAVMNHYMAVMAIGIPTALEVVPGIGHDLPGSYGYPNMRGEVGGRGLKVHFDCFAEAAAADGGVAPGTDGGGSVGDAGSDAASQGPGGRSGTAGATGTGGVAAAGGRAGTSTGGVGATGSGGTTLVATGGAAATGSGGSTPTGSGGHAISGSGGSSSPSGASGSSSGGCGCAAASGEGQQGPLAIALLAAAMGLLGARRNRRHQAQRPPMA